MKKLIFPDISPRAQAAIKNANELFDSQLSRGQRASDWLASTIGSWKFIIWQSFFFVVWIIINVTAFINHWDPYPFILMNLLLSTQAAYTAPVIMMSQNRQAVKDRIEAHNDYLINIKAEEEIRAILEQLKAQNLALIELHGMQDTISRRIDDLVRASS
ncbi:MAG: DUF1003 domain-containing protein [Candidatus Aminicenantes bacterium]|nr:DUF1003 domain-containing protein [Candidatus Aminicenantes bacterium]